MFIGISPGRENGPLRTVIRIFNLKLTSHGLRDFDRIREVRSLYQQDVGGVVVWNIIFRLISEVSVESFTAELGLIGIGIQHQYVNPFAAIERITTVLAFKPVGIATAEHNIITAAAEQLILSAAPKERINAARPVSQSIRRIIGACEIIS